MTPKQRSADEPVMQFRHTFSHYHLDIDVRELRHVQADDSAVHETSDRVWWDNGDELPGGVAAPVAKILTVTAGD